jgi:hypothetical protein
MHCSFSNARHLTEIEVILYIILFVVSVYCALLAYTLSIPVHPFHLNRLCLKLGYLMFTSIQVAVTDVDWQYA